MESPSRPCSNCGILIVYFFAGSCCALRCGDGISDGTIIPFVVHTLDKCRTVLSIRKAKNLKYKELVLRENINNKKTGYHAECCRKFNALGRNAPPKNDDVRSKSGHRRWKSTLASASLSIGMMPEIFIFYTKKDKKHDQEIGNNPRESSIIIQTEKRWFCRQRNTLLWHM